MKKVYLSIFWLITAISVSFAVQPQYTDLPFAYGEQLWISTFDGEWETDNNEPVNMPNGGGWHSFNTGSYGGVSGAARNRNQFNYSDEVRPGSPENARSARLRALVTLGVPANGNATTGRIRANMTLMQSLQNPAGAARNLTEMFNFTERADARFNTPFESRPDSVAVWVNFQLAPNSTVENQKARISIFIHGDTDFRDVPATAALRDQVVAFAGKEFAPTDGWVRLSIPFQYDSFVSYTTFTNVTASSATQTYYISGDVEPRYIIVTAATSHVPAVGTQDDFLWIDDFLMIYNPTLMVENMSGKSEFMAGGEIEISFTLTGTMSPYNLNAPANAVRLELSNATGSFENAVVLDTKTTNVSGVFTVNLPEGMEVGSGYRLRVVTTNYPMVSDNINIEIYVFPPTIEDITPLTAVCSGNDLTLTVPSVTDNGSTISSQGWEIETASGSGTFVTFNAPFTVTDADSGKLIRYTVVSNGGTVYSNAVTITVNPMPEAPEVSTVIYAVGSLASPLTAIGSNLQWFEDDNPESLPLSEAPTPLTTTETDSRSFWVSQTVNGCESSRAELRVEITTNVQIAILRDSILTLLNNISTLQNENSVLLDSISTLLGKNSTLQGEISTLQNANNSLQNENNALHDSIGNLHLIIVKWIDITKELSDSINWLNQLLENCEKTGVPVIPENQIQVFPNPVIHTLHVIVPNELLGENTVVELYNLTGKLVFSKPLNPHINGFTIDVSSFERGVYLLRIGNQVVKFLKQ